MPISHPSDISGLVLDLDPHVEAYEDSAGTIPASVGGAVGLVVDQTATGANASQSTSGRKPTLVQDANGWRYLTHDGVDDLLTLGQALRGMNAITVVAYAAPRSTANCTILADERLWKLRFSNNRAQLLTGNGSTWDQTGLNAGVLSVTPQAVCGAVDATTALVGSAEGENTTAGSNITFDNGYEVVVGAHHAGGSYLEPADLNWWRIVVYDRLLTQQERSDLYAYLNDLYSNPAGGGDPEPIDLSASITNAGQSPSGSASVEVAASGSLTNAGQTTSASVSVEASASGSAANAGQSVSGSAEVEVSASGALANAGQSPSGSASVEVSVSGTLTNAGQSVQGFIGEVPAQVSGAVTNGGQTLSGTLTTEAALSAVVANGGQQITGDAAVKVAASATVENAGQVIASAASVAVSLSAAASNAGQTINGRMVNGAVLVPSRITLSLESTHALSLSLESSHVLELSIE